MSVYEHVKWGVHIHGPDSILAATDFNQAVEKCNEFNSLITLLGVQQRPLQEYRPIVFATVFIWDEKVTHDPESTDWNELC